MSHFFQRETVKQSSNFLETPLLSTFLRHTASFIHQAHSKCSAYWRCCIVGIENIDISNKTFSIAVINRFGKHLSYCVPVTLSLTQFYNLINMEALLFEIINYLHRFFSWTKFTMPHFIASSTYSRSTKAIQPQ